MMFSDKLLEIIARLKREGYETRQIYGPMLFRQLSTLNKAARTILPNTDRWGDDYPARLKKGGSKRPP